MSRTVKKKSISTEVRIKEAAHKVFLAKGYSATSVRDVAKEARANVALVNYYFGSKKNLFDVVMLEKVQVLIGSLVPILNNEYSTLNKKIEGMVNSYIDFLMKNPELLSLIFNEVRRSNFEFISNAHLDKNVNGSYFMKQLKGECGDINPLHFLFSLVGMIAFPFLTKPTLLQIGLVNEKVFERMMKERKALIPVWVKAMLSSRPKPITNMSPKRV